MTFDEFLKRALSSRCNDEPRRRAAGYRRSARYGFYASLIPLVSKFLASLKPPQSGGVLNPLANKKAKH